MLDKELTALPLLGVLATVVVVAVFAFVVLGSATFIANASGSQDFQFKGWSWVALAAFYVVTTTISNYFAGAVIHGAATRFNGGDPTVGSSLRGASARFKSLFLFSLLASTVGLVLQAIQDRVPLAGKIVTWLAGAAWNVASFFALPIIILGKKEVSPIEATKQSVAMVRKVWGESIVAEAGIGLISVLLIVPYVLLGSGLAVGLAATGLTPVAIAVLVGLLVLGFFVIVLVTSVLGGIVKAALYHFATTGEAPESFNRELLRSALTPKKARKIFG